MNKSQTGSGQLFRSYALTALVARFQLEYGRFDSAKFVDRELTYKRQAAERLRDLLAKDHLASLIDEGRFEEAKAAIKRACAGTFEKQANNLLNQFDMLTITNAPAEALAITLYDLLYGTGAFPLRFEAWVDVLSHDKPGVWPTATYFLMMHDPDKHIFVKAEPYKKLVNALHSPLEWETRPTALRYGQIQNLAHALLQKLAPMGARDMIDLQSFIYVMFPTRSDASY